MATVSFPAVCPTSSRIDDLWWFVMIFGDFWWSLVIFGDFWWSLVIFGDFWWSLMIFGDLWGFLVIFDDLWWFLVIFDDLWWFLMMFDDVFLRSFWCCDRWSEKDMFGDCWWSLMICWWRNQWFCWVHFRQPPYVGFELWGLRSYIPCLGFHNKLVLTNTHWDLRNGFDHQTSKKRIYPLVI